VSNYQGVLDYVQSKGGILLLHTYKESCAACVGIRKNFKEMAKTFKNDKKYKDKYFLAE